MSQTVICRTISRWAGWASVIAAAAWIGFLLSPNAGRAQVDNSGDLPGAQVVLRGFELSGSAIVEGGVLIADDELVSSLLLLEKIGAAGAGQGGAGGELGARIAKLERKRKKSKPFTDKDKFESIQDFEGIASDRLRRVFMVGSHQGMDGERRVDREFIVQAEWDPEKQELEFKDIYRKLLTDVELLLAGAGAKLTLTDKKCTPDVNVEALGFDGVKLYMGLRAPLGAGGKAIMLSVKADDLFSKGFDGKFEVSTVAISGGFRSMDWDPRSKRLLILSGPPTDTPAAAPALHALDPASGAIELLHTFTEKQLTQAQGVRRGSPEGVSRLEDGRIMISLDRERGTVSEVLFLPATVGAGK